MRTVPPEPTRRYEVQLAQQNILIGQRPHHHKWRRLWMRFAALRIFKATGAELHSEGAIMAEVIEHRVIQKIARITAKTGQERELRDALKILEAATKEELGCVEFTFFQAISDEASFVLLEHFINEEAFEVHMQLPHTQAFFKTQLVAAIQAVDVPSLRGK